MTCSPVFNDPEGPHGSQSRDLAAWLSPDSPKPDSFETVTDQTTAAHALALARKGVGLLYKGDYHSARQLLAAMGRRLRKSQRNAPTGPSAALSSLFRAGRAQVKEEHELLSRLAVPLTSGYRVELRRAPDVELACLTALGPSPSGPALLPLRDLLGIIGAHEWRRRGIPVPALDARIYPHYGVYAPWRLEYVDLLAQACKTWPVEKKRAVDVGTGTGVLAFVLARNGARVVATDLSPRAVTCATENAAALGLLGQVEVRSADLLPGERFDLAVANPPWIPSEAHTPLDHAIYDPGGRFLKALVTGLDGALLPDGEAFLLLSDLAERLGLRKEGHLAALAKESGFTIQGELEASPTHKRSQDPDDPLHEARKAEVVRLFRLVRSS